MAKASGKDGADGGERPTLRYHWLRLRASCHATEDPAKVAAAVAFVAGSDVAPATTELESHHGGTVRLVEATLDRSRDVRALLQRVLDLPGARADLQASLESRTDDDGVFYLRFDKQRAAVGELVLTRGEDAVQARLKMEHYPATREAALASLGALLQAARV